MAYRQLVCKLSRCIYFLLQRHAINHHTEHRNDWGKHNQAVNRGLSRITNHFVIRLFGLDCFFQVLFLTLAHITPPGVVKLLSKTHSEIEINTMYLQIIHNKSKYARSIYMQWLCLFFWFNRLEYLHGNYFKSISLKNSINFIAWSDFARCQMEVTHFPEIQQRRIRWAFFGVTGTAHPAICL